MAEYKQYITQIQENGNVMISEDVVATIVAHALSEVEGVGSLGVKAGIGIADFGTKKNWGKSLKIMIAEDTALWTWLRKCRRLFLPALNPLPEQLSPAFP